MALRLGELLVINGLITRQQLMDALKMQKQTGRKLGSILVEMGAIREDILIKFLTDKFGVSTLDLNNYHINDSILSILPGQFCLQNRILPVDKFSNNLSVVMLDPFDEELKAKIESMTGFKVDPLVTSERSLNNALNKYYASKTMDMEPKTEIGPSASISKTPSVSSGGGIDDIDSILGFDKQEEIAPQPQKAESPINPTFLEKNVISPEIANLEKQNKILKDRVEEVKKQIVELVGKFNSIKAEIQKRTDIIDAYHNKLKPVEGTYTKFIQGMKDFYEQYQNMMEELKKIKANLILERNEIKEINQKFGQDEQKLMDIQREYEKMLALIEEEREKINKGIKDKQIRSFIASRLFAETYQGEDIEEIKEKAQKYYNQNVMLRNIFLGLIVLLLGVNVFFFIRGGSIVPAGERPVREKIDKNAEKLKQEELIKQQERIAEEQMKKEEERQAQLDAEKKSQAQIEAEKRQQEEQERLAKIESDKLAKEKTEADRRAREKSEADRRAREKSEADRKAREAAAKKVEYEYFVKFYESANRSDVDAMKAEFEMTFGMTNISLRTQAGKFVLYSGPYRTADAANRDVETFRSMALSPQVVRFEKK